MKEVVDRLVITSCNLDPLSDFMKQHGYVYLDYNEPLKFKEQFALMCYYWDFASSSYDDEDFNPFNILLQ
jgi:hypothetical protein